MKIGRKSKNEDMGIIWKNTLKASDQSDAEKMLAYAKEHYKEHGLEDFDEQSWADYPHHFAEFGRVF